MRFVEDTEGTWTAVQLKAVEQEMEQKKRDWEANRLAEQRRIEEAARKREAEERADLLTFSREDAKNQVNNTHPSNRVNRGGSSSRKRLRKMRCNDRTAAVSRAVTATTLAKTKTNNDRRTLKTTRTANSSRAGHNVSSKFKFEGGISGGGRGDKGGQHLTTYNSNRRVMPSAKQQLQKKHQTDGGVTANSKPSNSGGSILGKRKHSATVSKKQTVGGGSSRRGANLRRMKGSTRNAAEGGAPNTKLARRSVARGLVAADELEPADSSNESMQEEDEESLPAQNGSDSDDIADDPAGDRTDEDDVDPLKIDTPQKSNVSGRRGSQSGAGRVDDAVPPAIVAVRRVPRRSSVAARAVLVSAIQKGSNNHRQQTTPPPKVNASNSSRTKLSRASQAQGTTVAAVKSHSSSSVATNVAIGSTTNAADIRTTSEQEKQRDTATATTLLKSLDEFDSECSLDVMIDSNDAPDSDSNQMNSCYYTSAAGTTTALAAQDDDTSLAAVVGAHTVKVESRPASRGGQRSRDGSRSKTPNAIQTSPANSTVGDLTIDEASDSVDESNGRAVVKTTPRTRSRGTVKINLWTLDDSPMLPVYKRSSRSKTPQLSQQQANHLTDEKDSPSADADDSLKLSEDSNSKVNADSNHAPNHSTDLADATTEHQQSVKAINSAGTKGGSSAAGGGGTVVKNLKIVVNDLLKSGDTNAKKVSDVSDGFRTPTPTNVKFRRRLSKVGGRLTSASVSKEHQTNNRTLDGWLMKGTGRAKGEEVDDELHDPSLTQNHVSNDPSQSNSLVKETVASSAATSKRVDSEALNDLLLTCESREENDPLGNGEV
uniref:Uncharacterized protein n=1 Tax=Anopheles maculatus TaxID=74869 RepID=A0A182S950_9DIPT